VVGGMGRLIYFLRLHVSQAREILLRTARPSPTGLSASKVVAMRTQAHGKRRVRAGSGRQAAASLWEKRGNNVQVMVKAAAARCDKSATNN